MCKCTPQDTKCTPLPEQESIFRTFFAGRVRFGGIFRRSLRVTTKKMVINFFGKKKCTPPDKILATPMVRVQSSQLLADCSLTMKWTLATKCL